VTDGSDTAGIRFPVAFPRGGQRCGYLDGQTSCVAALSPAIRTTAAALGLHMAATPTRKPAATLVERGVAPDETPARWLSSHEIGITLGTG